MGVYIFQSKVDPQWVKVGHCKITARRPNVWYRVARRGFNSCICPRHLRNKTHGQQLELLAFYPNLCTKDEKKLHRTHKHLRTGEWYPAKLLPRLIGWLEEEAGGQEAPVSEAAKAKAFEWATPRKERVKLVCDLKKLPPRPSGTSRTRPTWWNQC
jgi:hypothetical protein